MYRWYTQRLLHAVCGSLDGGMWVQTAKQRIAAYFEEKLAEEVKSGKVVVML